MAIPASIFPLPNLVTITECFVQCVIVAQEELQRPEIIDVASGTQGVNAGMLTTAMRQCVGAYAMPVQSASPVIMTGHSRQDSTTPWIFQKRAAARREKPRLMRHTKSQRSKASQPLTDNDKMGRSM